MAKGKKESERKSEGSTPPLAIILFCIVVFSIVILFYPDDLDTQLPREFYSMHVTSGDVDILKIQYLANYSKNSGSERIIIDSNGSGNVTVRFGGFKEVIGPEGSSCSFVQDQNLCTYDASMKKAVFTMPGNDNPNARYTFSSDDPVEFSTSIVLGKHYVCDSPCVDSYDPEVSITHEPFPVNSIVAHNLYKREMLAMDTISFSTFLIDNDKVEENEKRQTLRELIFIPLVVGVILLFLEYVIMNKIFVRIYCWIRDHVMKLLGKEK